MKNRSFLWSAGVLSAGLVLASFSTQAQTAPERVSKPIPGQYLVVFKRDVRDPQAVAEGVAKAAGGQVMISYKHALKGAAIFVPNAKAEEALKNALANNPNVLSFEQDATVYANGTQNPATWGLDRIDQKTLPLNATYNYGATGANVYAFILDTGIRTTHKEFTGRLWGGATVINDGKGTNDCNGHGTHVAGTVAGTNYGVAKEAWLVPVRVLDCAGSGSWSGVIAGIDWVASQIAMRPAVANMSLGGGFSSTINTAVNGAVSKGVTMVVAAGNESTDACTKSPASAAAAITVGATGNTDVRASYSNYGKCVDLFAPGSAITSSWYTSDTAINTISGTSMAAPHVAGLAARALQMKVSDIPAKLLADATPGVVVDAGYLSPNLLAYSAADGSGTLTPLAPAGASLSMSIVPSPSFWSGKNWYARGSAQLAVPAQVDTTVLGNFSSGGSVNCLIKAGGNNCTLQMGFNSRVTSTTLSITGATVVVSGVTTRLDVTPVSQKFTKP